MHRNFLRALGYLTMAGLVATSGCSCYGPKVDRSRFVTAHLLPDQQVLFTYQTLVYRPAQGIAAFPDGGIPKYVRDLSYIGVYDIRSGKHRILKKERNTTFEPGQGPFHIGPTKGAMALVSQGGQVRGQLRGHIEFATRHWLCNAASGDVRQIDIKGEFTRRGRDVGEIYLVDDLGTLVFINNPLEQAKQGNYKPRTDNAQPEIWVRTPQGAFLKVVETSHYEEFKDGNVIYWLPDNRTFYAFHVADQTTTPLPGYKVRGYQDVTEGVILSAQGDRIELGHKTGDQWTYEVLPFMPDF